MRIRLGQIQCDVDDHVFLSAHHAPASQLQQDLPDIQAVIVTDGQDAQALAQYVLEQNLGRILVLALADLAGIIGPEFGQAVRVEVILGTDPARETPLEIEHRLYLGVREQVSRDLADDPNVQFLQQRFGAVLHPESIEPLSR